MHAPADPGPVEQIDGHLFQHAGADTALDIGPALALQHQAVDPGSVEKLGEQQTRTARRR